MRLLTLVFLSDSNNFWICLVPDAHICLCYLLILCFYFHLLFHTLFTTRHSTIFDSISLQTPRNIGYIKNTSYSTTKEKVTLIVTKPNDLIFWWYKVWVFLPLYELTFSLVFSQVTDQKSFLSYHILINILSMNIFLWQQIFKRYNVSYKVFSKLETFQNKKKQA